LQNPDQIDNDIDNLQKLKVAVGDYRKTEGEKTSIYPTIVALLQYHSTKGSFAFLQVSDSDSETILS
jgi:hypothetical protein